MKKQPTPLQKTINQIHILQTTVKELQDAIASNKTAIERRDRMLTNEVKRSNELAEKLGSLSRELIKLQSKWYVRWFG